MLGRQDAETHDQPRDRVSADDGWSRLVSENATDVISVHAPDGTWRYASPSCRRILGYEPGELMGRLPSEFIHPDDLEAMRASHRSILRTPGVSTTRYRIRRKDGAYVWFETTSRTARDASGAVVEITAASRDITDRKRAEDEFEAQRVRYEQILEAQNELGQGIVVSEGHGIVFANEAFLRIVGYSWDEVRRIPSLFDVVAPEERETLVARFAKRSRGESVPSSYESVLVRKDGGRVDVEIAVKVIRHGDAMRALSLVRDVTDRKKAEEALRESEQRFRLVFEQSPLGIILVGDDFRFREVNDAMCRITGYSRHELVGKTFAEITHPEDVDKDVVLARRLFKGDIPSYSMEKRYITKRNEIRWIHLTGTIVRNSSGHPFYALGIIEDIHERKLARDTRARLAAAFDGSVDGILTKDLEGTITSWNRSCERMYGYSAEEAVGRHVDILLPSDSEPVEAVILERVRRGEAVTIPEGRRVRKDGSSLWVSVSVSPVRDAEGRVVGAASIHRDITDRREAEASLRTSERRFRGLLEAAPDALVVADEAGRIQFANRQTMDLFGYAADEILGLTVDDLMPARVRAAHVHHRAEYAQHPRARPMGQGLDLVAVRKDGSEFPVEISLSPIPANGDHVLVAAAVRDVTERKREERRAGAQYAIARALVESDSFDAALPRVLTALAESFGCARSEYWAIGRGGRLRLAYAVAPDEDDALRAFGAYSEGVSFARGEGLPGRCWAEIRPQSAGASEPAPDLAHDPKFFRAEAANWAGLRSAVAFPVVAVESVRGAIVLLSRRRGVHEEGTQDFWEAVQSQISQFAARKDAEVRLRESESMLAEAQRIAQLGSWEWNVGTGVLIWSEEVYRILGVSPEEARPTYDAFIQVVHPDDREAVERAVERSFLGAPYSLDHRIVRADGSVRVVHEEGEVSRDEDGKPVRMTGTVIDVTERTATEERIHRSLREKEALLREIHHRVKNNLQIVSSLLSLQSEHAPEPLARAALVESRNRVKSMALVHERLYRSTDLSAVDLGEYVRDLAQQVHRSYGETTRRVSLIVDAEPAAAKIDVAVNCGLVLNELVSNAFKHAFPGGRAGEVRVRLEREGADRMRLVVADDGVGVPEDFDIKSTATMGLQLVSSLVDQMDGSVEIGRGRGTEFRIEVPLDPHEEE